MRTGVLRSLGVAAVAFPVIGLAIAGCRPGGSPGAAATTTTPPALAQVSTAAAAPVSKLPPGPEIRAACPLVSAAKVASLLGVPSAVATERPAASSGGSAVYTCNYQAGGQSAMVIISVSPVTVSADQAASLAIRRYTGTMNSVPGVGDAAYYNDSAPASSATRVEGLVTARAEGHQMRLVILTTYLGGSPRAPIIALARAVLAKI
jgi:hypothetical protein